MSNKEVMNNSFESLFEGIDSGMLPPPKLEEAVIAGTYYKGNVGAGMHIRKISVAIVAYAVGIMLFLGALLLLPKLFDTQEPVGRPTSTIETTITTAPNTLPPPGELVEAILWYESFDEFTEFYEVFKRQNQCPIVSLQFSEDYAPSYRFYGGIISHKLLNGVKYPDYPFSKQEFSVEAYVNPVSDSLGGIQTCDMGIFILSHQLSNPINSLDAVEIRKAEVDMDGFYKQVAINCRTEIRMVNAQYEFYAENQLIMTVWIFNALQTSEQVYEDFCADLISQLVCME